MTYNSWRFGNDRVRQSLERISYPMIKFDVKLIGAQILLIIMRGEEVVI